MITINEQTLKELILTTDPCFLILNELELNGYGQTRWFGKEDNEPTWIWNKERIRGASQLELNYLITKIIE